MPENVPIIRDPQIRKSIIAGVIAGLLVLVFIQPLLRLIWSTLLSYGSLFLQGFIDSFYANAAFGHRNYVDIMLMMCMFSILIGIMLGINLSITHSILQPKPRPREPRKYRLVYIWLFFFIFTVSALYQVVRPYADMQLNTSFQQRLKILAPALSDFQMKEFEAAWASMKTRADYLVIKSRMEQAATQHNIVLPEALWK